MDNKVNLADVTFLVLVRLDSIDRLENILETTQFLDSNFETNIWVSEYASYNNGLLEKLLNKNIRYTFSEDYDPILYRTRFLNQMSQSVLTPYVAIWDTDVIAPVGQILISVELLRNGEADFVYPYDNYFYDTTPVLRKLYIQERNIELLEQNTKKMKEMYSPNPVGGAFLANLNTYKEAGLENESFYGWGLEDGERVSRWGNLDYKIHRVNGPLFHLSHGRGVNSVFHNDDQHFSKKKEIKKVRRNTSSSCLQLNDIHKNI
jgi:predicted glycosyltransferase involved in capsule biosynthesis